MPRPSKVWWWEKRNAYYTTIAGVRHRLSEDKQEATQEFHRLMARPPAKPPVIDSQSVVAIIDAFLDELSRTRAKATYTWYKGFLQPLAQVVQHLRIDELKPFHIKAWINQQEWGNSTRRGAITCVKRCFSWAVKEGYLEASPVVHMEKPEAGKRNIVISPQRFKALLALVKDRPFRDLLEFTWETGARPQEVTALEARHVELTNQRIVFPEEESKGRRRPRIIYMTPKALAIVKRLIGNGHIFLNKEGRPFTKDSINCRFRNLQYNAGQEEIRKAGITIPAEEIDSLKAKLKKTVCEYGVERTKAERELRQEARRKLLRRAAMKHTAKLCLYTLRHSFCHRLLTAGVDSLTVSVLMGHQSPNVVATTYSHLAQANHHLLAALKRA